MLDVLRELIKLTDSLLNLVTVGTTTSNSSTTDIDTTSEQHQQTPTTWVTGTVVKTSSRNYLKVNFVDIGIVLLSISQYDNAIKHFSNGDRASGLLCRLCIGEQWATYNANRKARYGDISNGYIYPSTLKAPVAIEHDQTKVANAVTPDQPRIDTSTPIISNEPTSQTSEDTVTVETKGQQFTVAMGNYRLDCRKTSNTTLWQNIDGVLREAFNWNTITQILESAVLDAGLSIKKAHLAYKRLVETAISSYGLRREIASEWWQALSDLAQE